MSMSELRVDAVVIGTRPEIAEDTMRECAELGIKHVWMHWGGGASPTVFVRWRDFDLRLVLAGGRCARH